MVSLVDQIYHEIGSNIRTITCDELHKYKRDFYQDCYKYMNHTDNLTGITELIINLFFANFIRHKSYTISTNYSVKGHNGKDNELDLVLKDSDGKITLGCSVKHKYSGTKWEKHEMDSEVCQKLKKQYGSKNITQDLFRIMNIKSISPYKYPTLTVIFDCLENVKQENNLRKIKVVEEYNHSYLVLEKNNEAIWSVIDRILQQTYEKIIL